MGAELRDDGERLIRKMLVSEQTGHQTFSDEMIARIRKQLLDLERQVMEERAANREGSTAPSDGNEETD